MTVESTQNTTPASELESILNRVKAIRYFVGEVETSETGFNAISRGVYIEVEPLAKSIDASIHAFYEGRKSDPKVGVEGIDEVSASAVGMAALCGVMKSLPNGDFDLPAIENIIFGELRNIERQVTALLQSSQ